MRKIGSFAIAVIFGAVAVGVVPSVYAQEEPAKPKAKTGQGALVGGLLGAVAGGVIGKDSGKTTEGVLIGGAVGALGGAAVGSQMKSKPAPKETPASAKSSVPAASQTVESAPQAAPAASKVTMKQVIYWTEQGLPNDEIISRIKKTDTVFILTPDDIDYLQSQNVSQRVIEAMQETGLPTEKQ
jgi:predicted lipid-binding transport protein (Tim44 family)